MFHQHLQFSVVFITIIKPNSQRITLKQTTSHVAVTIFTLHSKQYSLCCVLLHVALIRVCAHTVILKQYAHFHSGTSRPHCGPVTDGNLRPSLGSRFVVVRKVRRKGKLIGRAWDHVQVHFAVNYSLARWCWHLGSATLTMHTQTSTKATE